VQHVAITDAAEAAARWSTERVDGLTVEQGLTAPFVWVGTAAEIAHRLRGHLERRGISGYVVGAAAVDAVSQVLARLRSPAR
jgi:hypothetical protein